jgi:protein SCO1
MLAATVLSILLLQTPDSILTKIGIEQNLGADIDPAISFRDENGRVVKLAEFLGKKPILLTPVYFGCPMLCGMQLNALVRALKVLPFAAGKEFEIISFSFDPNEGPELARSKKEHYIRDYGKEGAEAGWHFLTADPEAIEKLTKTIGFEYAFDDLTGQWAHASTLVVLTPTGRISQYLNGIDYDQQSLKYSLIEASDNKVGTIIDRVLLFCYQYDPHSGKYSLVIMSVMRLASVAMMLGIVVLWVTTRNVRSGV